MLNRGFSMWRKLVRNRIHARPLPRRRRQLRQDARAAVVERLEHRLLLTTFSVNSLVDTVDINPGDGIAADANGNTTLRAAIMEANALAGDDTIEVGAGTVSLTRSGFNEDAATTGDLDILNNGSIVIMGTGADLTTINAHGMGDRVFDVWAGASLTLEGLTIRNASGVARTGVSQPGFNGGAIQNNAGSVVINDSVLTGNRASNRGAGIYNHSGGSVTLSGSTISGNRAKFGGGIYTTGPGSVVTMIDSTLSGNSVSSGSSGAGIYNNGGNAVLTITDTTVSGNSAGNGGGVYNTGQLTITGSTFSGNSASSGGGIDNRHTGVADIINSTFVGNSAGAGGAIRNTHTGITNITGSTFSGNSAGSGGAVYNGFQGGELTIIDSTLSGNSAVLGGAIRNTSSGGSGIAHIRNSTLSGNSADSDGGAIYNASSGSRVNISNGTLTGNRADANGTGTGSGGGLYNDTFASFVTLDHTIVAGNLRGTGTVADEFGGDVSTASSFNLIADVGTAGGLSDGSNGNIVATIPVASILVTALADNGGPTLTHTLAHDSPAIDAGNPNFDDSALPNDQRGSGFARTIGSAIDIGAFERQNAAPTAAAGGPYVADEGTPFMLDASGSTDPDEPTAGLTFEWDLDYDGATLHVDAIGETPTVSFPDDFAPRTIALRVTDSAGESSIATTTLAVRNVAPELVAPSAIYEVVENSANGTPVATIVADDPGADTLSYEITGGTGETAFAINAVTGEITVADSTQLDYETTPSFTLEVKVSDDDDGFDTTTLTINLLNQASIIGTVFVDANENGLYEAIEMGIDGVTVELLDSTGTTVIETTETSEGGFYLFEDYDPGTYRVRQVQPTGVTDGDEFLGNLGGTIISNDVMEVTLNRSDAEDYDFAEIGQSVGSGDTATIGFWQNKHGQALIEQGGTSLATWLTENFGNVFGDEFVGADGADVAKFYKGELFRQKAKKSKKSAGPAKVDAQFMALTLATYFTSEIHTGGTVAADYGFNVTDTGIGTKIFNVGSSGAAFGVADNTDLTIMQLLQATNSLTDQPDNVTGFALIYDTNGDGVIDSTEAALRSQANSLFALINEQGAH